MTKVDWSKAPEGAEFFAAGKFRKIVDVTRSPHFFAEEDRRWCEGSSMESIGDYCDFEYRPMSYAQWPEESRIDIIGTNGNTGEAYVHYEEFREKVSKGPSVYNNAPKGNPSETTAKSNYERLIVGLDGTKTTVDVYRVLDAFKTDSAAIDHAIKKLLAPGLRHSKDRKQDLKEAIDSIAAELLLMEQK